MTQGLAEMRCTHIFHSGSLFLSSSCSFQGTQTPTVPAIINNHTLFIDGGEVTYFNESDADAKPDWLQSFSHIMVKSYADRHTVIKPCWL